MPKKTKITIGENDIKQKDVEMVNVLLKQMDPVAPPINFAKARDVMKFGTIITLRNRDTLIGMGTLIPRKKLFSFCGLIEDLVVEENYRNKGLGMKVLKEILKKSKKLEMKFVDLTSNPKRKKANNLYPAAGFEFRKTNEYRFWNYR